MKPIFHLLTAAAALGLCSSLTAAGPAPELIQELNARLQQQLAGMTEFETLRQVHTHPRTVPPESHTYLVRLRDGVEVVTESSNEEGVILQKDYFLHQSQVYAYRVSHQEPCMDGKKKRVSENFFFLDQGKVIYRTVTSMRVPLATPEPNLSKAQEKAVPLPVNANAFGKRLNTRAFDIVRSFRPGVGQHVFADWDEWLLKEAPPPGVPVVNPQPASWVPPSDVSVLPIPATESPDGLFQLGWGYDQGPIDWKLLAFYEEHTPGKKWVTYSTKLASHPLPPELEKDGTYLLNHVTGKPAGKLIVHHAGQRQRFNHDEILTRWSPANTCFITYVTEKWFTQDAGITWIKDGISAGSQAILQPLETALRTAVQKSKHPAAQRVKDVNEEFMFTLTDIMVEDDGAFEAQVNLQVPRDDQPSGYVNALIKGKFQPAPDSESATLTEPKITLLPPRTPEP